MQEGQQPANEEDSQKVRDLVVYGPILERDRRPLKVALTAEEIRAASRRMGALFRQRTQEEAAFETTKKEHKARIDSLESEMARLGVILDTEQDERDVECVTKVNWDDGTAETIRCDTKERIATRPLTQAERQAELFRRDPNGRGKRGRGGGRG